MLSYPEIFILKWGYAGIFIGSMINSEPIVASVSFLCSFLKFKIRYIFILSFLGSVFGSLILFFIGKIFKKLINSMSFFEQYSLKINPFIESYGVYFIIGFRFIYGIKLVSPIILGLSNIKFSKFFISNIVGALLWSVAMILLGWCLSLFFKNFSFILLLYIYIFTVLTPFVFIGFYTFFIKRILYK